MDWWIWILIGMGLLAVEVLTPGGFYMLFFGAGALVVGALVALGTGGSLAVQCLLFSLGSIAALVLFRPRLLDSLKLPSGREVDSMGQSVAVLLEDLPAQAVGKAEMRGTTWSVRNVEEGDLPRGQRCRVVRVDGLTLWVKAE